MRIENYDEKGRLVSSQDVADDQRVVNRDAILGAARQALAANRAFVASTPTAAQMTTQVKVLSRQVNGLLRLLLDELDGTD